MNHLIGLCGPRGSGKSYIAKILVEEYGYKEVSFADPLKRGIKEIFGLSDDQLYGDAKEDVDPFWVVTPRRLMQVVGTELFRNELPRAFPEMRDVWVRIAERRITQLLHSGERVVVSDVRFDDEAQLIRRRGGVIGFVARPHAYYASNHDVENHSSETLHVDADFRLVNDETLQLRLLSIVYK